MSTEAGPPVTVGGGRYTLGDLIGRGGAAEVYRARDELLGRDVAVKLFPAGVGEADESRRQREVQTLAGMNHPGLVTIYDVGAEGSRAYFVMQLVEGDSLAERLRVGPLALGDVVALGAALADALTYVHRHGVVHRDIKPGNVLLDQDGRPHLSDFGIAVLADATNITATGMVIGTASYLSPEQVRGQPVGPASDVYALGLVLLECITARREYPGNALEAAVARLHRPPDVPADLPGPLASLIVAMTYDEPEDRPTTEQVAGELRLLARDVGLAAETVLAPSPMTGPTNAMRTGALGAAGAGLAGTGATRAVAGSPRNAGTSSMTPTGATQRVAGAGYGSDRTAVVGGRTGAGAGVVGGRAAARRGGGRGGMIAAVAIALVALVGFGTYFLVSGNDTAPPPATTTTTPSNLPPVVPSTTTTEETTRRTTTRRTTEERTTTVAPPPVITTIVPPTTVSQTTTVPPVPPNDDADAGG